MQLLLEKTSKKVGPATWLYRMSLAPRPGEVTVWLGATQAGKTSVMRVMAGLDVPSAGRVPVNGADVTGVPVREPNVAMVYQPFINAPSLRVANNIGSPLKLRGEKDAPPACCLRARARVNAFARHPLAKKKKPGGELLTVFLKMDNGSHDF